MNMMKDSNVPLQKVKMLIMVMLALFMGVVIVSNASETVEARTVLPKIEMGSRKTAPNQGGAKTYKYLLSGNSSKGFLPDIKNLGKYGYGNKGWGIDTPTREGIDGGGGRELSHSVFPSTTYYHEVNGVKYLRISGTAVAPKFFHMTDKNHRVAILSREDGKNSTIKLWETNLWDLTSSASYDYGYGIIDGNNDWRAAVYQSPHGYLPVHVTNDPYPNTAEKATYRGDSKYFDSGYGNMFGASAFNRNQVAKLCGLGSVGNRLVNEGSKQGCNYIMDYTGFVVDIPVNALVSSSGSKHKYDFDIVMTMTTPKGKSARVYGQKLSIPGVTGKRTTVLDVNEGYEGNVRLDPSDVNSVRYAPGVDSLMMFKNTSNVIAHKYGYPVYPQNPPKSGSSSRDTLRAEKDKPRFVAWGNNKFKKSMYNYINDRKGSVDFAENKGWGRGSMYVGFDVPGTPHKVYTEAGQAYTYMPSAEMFYTPTTKTKPVVVRHRVVSNNDFRNPKTVFKTNQYSVRRSGGGVTAKPLTSSQLRNFGTNLKFLGKSRVGTDTTINTADLRDTSGSGFYLNNSQLYSAQYNRGGILYIDLYYSGTPKPTDPINEVLTYAVDHKETNTWKLITKGDSGEIESGSSHTVSAIRPYGYVSNNKYKVNNGATRNGRSYLIENNSSESSNVNVTFFYKKRLLNIEVEHRNSETNRKIAQTETGRTVNLDTSYIARPLSSNELNGYTFANQYSLNGGAKRSGNNYRVSYDDEADKMVVTFYYDWNDPEDSTKRFQGDSEGGLPIDMYINAGLITTRDASGRVTGTSLEANTSAILDTHEAPIAIASNGGSIEVNGSTSRIPNRGSVILNDEYVDSISLDRRVGNSRDANGFNGADVDVENSTVDMSLGSMSSSLDVEREGIGKSKGSIGVTEDRDTAGRWIGSDRTMRNWTPMGLMSRSLTYSGDVNGADSVDVTYDIEVYNRMKHNYVSRVGSDGLEYYEYTGSELMSGYYAYSGDTIGRLMGGNKSVSSTLDISDIDIDEYVDAKGFNVGTGESSPAQFKVASERVIDMGKTSSGYSTDTIERRDAETVVRGSNNYSEQNRSERYSQVDYYEEFGYVAYHGDDEVLTQQAIPVGGQVAYLNPYEYASLPSYTGVSVMEKSGYDEDELENNLYYLNDRDQILSQPEFSPEHSGFYLSDKDEFDTFNMDSVSTSDKNYMENSLEIGKQYNPDSMNGTGNYETYKNTSSGYNSRYVPAGEVQTVGHFEYKQPVVYSTERRDVLLEDVVAVGKDSGFPVVGDPATLLEDYKERYEQEFGVVPSDTDEVTTINKGSIYLIPLNNEGQTSDDIYRTRLYLNDVGISRVDLVDDKELTFDKYLYGRGENVIYSGQRSEPEIRGEFREEQRVGQDAQPEETGQVNGVRTRNNKEFNDKVMDDE